MRIAIVNDLNIAIESLRRVIISDGSHQICWIARNGAEAVAFCKQDIPDLILMDMIMPVMNGVEATKRIMTNHPCPILIVTSSVTAHASLVFEAMGAGALDAVVTPVLEGETKQASCRALLGKISLIGKLTCQRLTGASAADRDKTGETVSTDAPPPLIVIGCSTGGPNALVKLLPIFPKKFYGTVVVIQHLDEQFTDSLAGWLNKQSPLPVMVPEDGETIKTGRVFLPSTSGHVILDEKNRLRYTKEPRDNFYHPSVDVFFQSVAKNHSSPGVGVLLTGMGSDGGKGLLSLKERGFLTLAQDRETSVVYGMPKYAKELGAAKKILPIEKMGREIMTYLSQEGPAKEK